VSLPTFLYSFICLFFNCLHTDIPYIWLCFCFSTIALSFLILSFFECSCYFLFFPLFLFQHTSFILKKSPCCLNVCAPLLVSFSMRSVSCQESRRFLLPRTSCSHFLFSLLISYFVLSLHFYHFLTIFRVSFIILSSIMFDRLCGLVRVPGYRSRGPGSDSRRYQNF
jgi:hypothetical protein